MNKLTIVAIVIAGLLLVLTTAARAQYAVPSQVTDREGAAAKSSGPTRSAGPAHDYSLGASFNFVTSERALGGRDLDFTDLMLLRVHTAFAWANGFELFAGTDVLPKQPSYTDEYFWQGALLGAQYSFESLPLALWLRAEGGPQIGRDGEWLTSDAAARYRLELAKELFFEATLGGTYNQLFFTPKRDQGFWFVEVLTQVGLAIRDKKGQGAIWMFFDMHFPVAKNPRRADADPETGAYLDPQNRVSFHLGGTVRITDTVGLFAEWTILDRGDLSRPATLLPAVNGGFDQRQLIFGFVKHFPIKAAPPPQRDSRQQAPAGQQQQRGDPQ
jgi:hypothetical protein